MVCCRQWCKQENKGNVQQNCSRADGSSSCSKPGCARLHAPPRKPRFTCWLERSLASLNSGQAVNSAVRAAVTAAATTTASIS